MRQFRQPDRKPTRLAVALLWLVVQGVVGCAAHKAADQGGPQPSANLSMREYGVNKDKPAIREFGKEVPDPDKPGSKMFQVERRELDLNHDGKPDVFRYYNDKGELVEEDFDLDFDGKIDAKSFYEAGQLVRQEMDENFDGKPDIFRYYEKGKLARKEVDRNFSGRCDYFEYYENGELDRIGIDKDGDGKPDVWEQKKEKPAP